ncbi:cytosolic phospholipase A2 gamma-like isoform X3 [Epinephelus lanceolatus]|uniref:cytosolic phospholipase A2 gamma-like isoform X3 n=1 Tax=Epinephelus lanceolatus TaxID=310571 RepID=UPI001446CABB|nr:cytosolic phospholipase A2 gamma-like isoform X3 [Epinephelus lanceolatus]
MQTGSCSISVIFLWLVTSAVLAKAVDNMEGNTAASKRPIRQSQSLCAGEQEYVHKRKQVVLESLRRLGINCAADSVPHIALLASGGGQRAAVGLVGSLYQMEKEDLLDTLLYLGGVSGSTWSMSSIYSDPQWSTNMDTAVSRLSGPGVELGEAFAWINERSKDEYFSLTDVWGVLTSAGIMKQMDLRHLSDEVSRNATNPYPIYSAIEKHCFSDGPIEGKWLEVSPHEAGFTELGLFIETSLLGSKFEGGELLEEKPEMDMVTLQGMVNHNKSVLLESNSSAERKGLFQHWSLELLAAVETWSQSLEDGPMKTHVSVLTKKVLPMIMKWEWGTTANFLYQYPDSMVPLCLRSEERFHLVDAGLLINVAYPPFLGDKRDIDLIVAPEYSAGNMFETLTLARDYAAEVRRAFPDINNKTLEERDWPKDCYVFEGKQNEPSIIYLPLFNRRNCKDAEEVKAKMEEFSTFQRPFSQEKIEFVLEVAKDNIKNNKETLLREINKAVLRQHNKRKSMQH